MHEHLDTWTSLWAGTLLGLSLAMKWMHAASFYPVHFFSARCHLWSLRNSMSAHCGDCLVLQWPKMPTCDVLLATGNITLPLPIRSRKFRIGAVAVKEVKHVCGARGVHLVSCPPAKHAEWLIVKMSGKVKDITSFISFLWLWPWLLQEGSEVAMCDGHLSNFGRTRVSEHSHATYTRWTCPYQTFIVFLALQPDQKRL